MSERLVKLRETREFVEKFITVLNALIKILNHKKNKEKRAELANDLELEDFEISFNLGVRKVSAAYLGKDLIKRNDDINEFIINMVNGCRGIRSEVEEHLKEIPGEEGEESGLKINGINVQDKDGTYDADGHNVPIDIPVDFIGEVEGEPDKYRWIYAGHENPQWSDLEDGMLPSFFIQFSSTGDFAVSLEVKKGDNAPATKDVSVKIVEVPIVITPGDSDDGPPVEPPEPLPEEQPPGGEPAEPEPEPETDEYADIIKEFEGKRIGVLRGGDPKVTTERVPSLKTGKNVIEALKNFNFDIVDLPIGNVSKDMNVESVQVKGIANVRKVESRLKNADIDVAFIALHGGFGEDGQVQQILEGLGIPYTGSGVKASEIAMDKEMTNDVLREKGLVVPKGFVIKKEQVSDEALGVLIDSKKIEYPVIMKPVKGGSSVGLVVGIEDEEKLKEEVRAGFADPERVNAYRDGILVEESIDGREMTVGVLMNKKGHHEALPVWEIKLAEGIKAFTEDVKYYESDGDHDDKPVKEEKAEIPADKERAMQGVATTAFDIIGCYGFARIDMRLNSKEEPVILDVNTIPGLTGASLLPQAAAHKGIDFDHLILLMLSSALLARGDSGARAEESYKLAQQIKAKREEGDKDNHDLKIRVLDKDGDPVDAIKVNVITPDKEEGTKLTDDKGECEFKNVPHVRYKVKCRYPFFEEWMEVEDIDFKGQPGPIDVKLSIKKKVRSNLTLVVKDSGGGVVPNVIVKLKRGESESERTPRTSDKGICEFKKMPHVDYDVLCKYDYEDWLEPVKIGFDGGTDPVVVQIGIEKKETNDLNIVVRDRNEQVVPKIFVELGRGTWYTTKAPLTSDEGIVQFGHTTYGEYLVKCGYMYEPWMDPVKVVFDGKTDPVEARLDIERKRVGRLNLVLKDIQGIEIPAVLVNIVKCGSGHHESKGIVTKNGRCAFNSAEEGQYKVWWGNSRDKDKLVPAKDTIDYEGEEEPVDVMIDLDDGEVSDGKGTLNVKVTKKGGGEVGDWNVGVYGERVDKPGDKVDERMLPASGSLTFENVPYGPVRVEVVESGRKLGEVLETFRDDNQEISVEADLGDVGNLNVVVEEKEGRTIEKGTIEVYGKDGFFVPSSEMEEVEKRLFGGIPIGPIKVLVKQGDKLLGGKRDEFKVNEQEIKVAANLDGTGTLKVKVSEEEGKSLEGCTLFVKVKDNDLDYKTMGSGVDYVFDDVSYGQVEVKVKKKGREVGKKEVNFIEDNKEISVEAELGKSGKLKVNVSKGGVGGLEGCTLIVRGKGDHMDHKAMNSEGDYVFDDVPYGPVTAKVRRDNEVLVEKDGNLRTREGEIEVVVDLGEPEGGTGTLKVKVSEKEGRGLGEYFVQVEGVVSYRGAISITGGQEDYEIKDVPFGNVSGFVFKLGNNKKGETSTINFQNDGDVLKVEYDLGEAEGGPDEGDDYEGEMNLANIAFGIGDYGAALEGYKRALALRDGDPEASAGIRACEAKLGEQHEEPPEESEPVVEPPAEESGEEPEPVDQTEPEVEKKVEEKSEFGQFQGDFRDFLKEVKAKKDQN